MKHTTVADVMTTAVLAIDEETPFTEIADIMFVGAVRALPVLGPDRTLVGVVSEADILVTAERADPQDSPHHRWRPRARHTRRGAPVTKAGATTARELMSAEVVTVEPTATVARAARLMREQGLAWLPVVDDRRRVVGVLGRSDLLAVFYRRDADIRAEIIDEVLGKALQVPADRVVVKVARGVVTLTGRLDTHADAKLAGRLAERVEGVVAVVDHLRWSVDERVADAVVGPLY